MPAPPRFTAQEYTDALAAARASVGSYVTTDGAVLSWWQWVRVKFGGVFYWGAILAAVAVLVGLLRRRR